MEILIANADSFIEKVNSALKKEREELDAFRKEKQREYDKARAALTKEKQEFNSLREQSEETPRGNVQKGKKQKAQPTPRNTEDEEKITKNKGGTKLCSNCDEEKEKSAFGPAQWKKPDGLCKKCTKKKMEDEDIFGVSNETVVLEDVELNEKQLKKKQAKEQKKKAKENEKTPEDADYINYNIKHKDEHYQQKVHTKEYIQKQKEEADKQKLEKQKKLEADEKGKARHSKPPPAKTPFDFFKEDHPKWELEKLKEEWKKLSEENKEPYKEKSRKEKEKRKQELEEHKKIQEALKIKKSSAGQGRQVLGKKK